MVCVLLRRSTGAGQFSVQQDEERHGSNLQEERECVCSGMEERAHDEFSIISYSGRRMEWTPTGPKICVWKLILGCTVFRKCGCSF